MPMPSSSNTPDTEDVKQGFYHYATLWGQNSVPPMVTAALIAGQHLRPFQTIPMLFPPILLFSSYLNVNGFKTDSAGITSAWSAAYMILARRRKYGFKQRFGLTGIIRGTTLALCAMNVVSGGLVYAFSKREVGEEGDAK